MMTTTTTTTTTATVAVVAVVVVVLTSTVNTLSIILRLEIYVTRKLLYQILSTISIDTEKDDDNDDDNDDRRRRRRRCRRRCRRNIVGLELLVKGKREFTVTNHCHNWQLCILLLPLFLVAKAWDSESDSYS